MNADPVEYLARWVENYSRYKATFTGKIQDMNLEGNVLRVTHSNQEDTYLLLPFSLDMPEIAQVCADAEKVFVVSFNLREVLAQIVENWKELASHKNLRIVMTNPFTKRGDTRWVVCPAIHAKWTDPAALEKGLKSLFKSVEALTREKALKKIKKEM